MINSKSLIKGHVYTICKKGEHQSLVAEVVDFDCTDRPVVKVLSSGEDHGKILKKQEFSVYEFLAETVESRTVQAALASG